MKFFPVALVLILLSCAQQPENKAGKRVSIPDQEAEAGKPADKQNIPGPYANERFREVTVTANKDSFYTIKGKAQVFEAVFGWALLSGEKELLEGHEMTDAGAPEFGNFTFRINRTGKPGGNLHLLLFESSPKDGTRQYILDIPLP